MFVPREATSARHSAAPVRQTPAAEPIGERDRPTPPHISATWDIGRIPILAPDRAAPPAPDAPHVLRAGGRPLDSASLAYFEPRLGADLSHVRVHTGQAAARSANVLNALAYTAGRHIVFDNGSYAPGSDQGRRLLAHELAHVLQQTGGDAPGAAQERHADATAQAVLTGKSPQGKAPSRIGVATQPKPMTFDEDLLNPSDPQDRRLGIKIVTVPQIEAKIRAVLAKRSMYPQVGEGRRAFNANPSGAKASLYHTHFRDDAERLAFAIGFFETFLGVDGDVVKPADLLSRLVAYETQMQSKVADLVVHSPPTLEEQSKLIRLRQQRKTEAAAREAERAKQAAEREAVRARQEVERAKRAPEDLAEAGCGDITVSGPYTDHSIALPYDKLVPDPNPRKGFDPEEVKLLLKDPKRMEQLYFDATHGYGKAAWLICAFESNVRQQAIEVAQNTSIFTFRGFVQSTLGTGGYDFGRLGFSPDTASGKRMAVLFFQTLAAKGVEVRAADTIAGNALTLLGVGKLVKGAAVPVDTAPPKTPAPANQPRPTPTPAPPEPVTTPKPTVKPQTPPPTATVKPGVAKPRSPGEVQKHLEQAGLTVDEVRGLMGGGRANRPTTASAARTERLIAHFTKEDLKALGKQMAEKKMVLDDAAVDALVAGVRPGEMAAAVRKAQIAEVHGEATRTPANVKEKSLADDAKARTSVTRKPSPGPEPRQFLRGNFAHRFAEFIFDRKKLPRPNQAEVVVSLRDGTGDIIRVDRVVSTGDRGVLLEIKPAGPSAAKGRAQLPGRVDALQKEFPKKNGWRGEVIEYTRAEVEAWLQAEVRAARAAGRPVPDVPNLLKALGF